MGEHEDAGAVGRLHPAGLDAGGAGQGGLLVDDLAAEGQLDRPALVPQRAELAGRVAHLGQHLDRYPEDLAQPRVEAPGVPIRMELGPRGGRGLGGEAGAEPVAEERVHRPHPQGVLLAGLLHAVVVLEQPGDLGGGEVGVVRQAAELLTSSSLSASWSRISWERLSCQTTIGLSGLPLSASQASTDSPW